MSDWDEMPAEPVTYISGGPCRAPLFRRPKCARELTRAALAGAVFFTAAYYPGGEAALTIKNGDVRLRPPSIADIENYQPAGLNPVVLIETYEITSTAAASTIISFWPAT